MRRAAAPRLMPGGSSECAVAECGPVFSSPHCCVGRTRSPAAAVASLQRPAAPPCPARRHAERRLPLCSHSRAADGAEVRRSWRAGASAADLQPTSTAQHGTAAPVACPSHLILPPAWLYMLGSRVIQPAHILGSSVHRPLTPHITSHPQPHLPHVAHLHARGGRPAGAADGCRGCHAGRR